MVVFAIQWHVWFYFLDLSSSKWSDLILTELLALMWNPNYYTIFLFLELYIKPLPVPLMSSQQNRDLILISCLLSRSKADAFQGKAFQYFRQKLSWLCIKETVLLDQEQIFFFKALLNYLEIQIQTPMVVGLLAIRKCNMIQTKQNGREDK